MLKFKLIEHTADIGLTAYGGTLAEAFANAAYGMFSIIAELKNVKETESREIELDAADIESLLFDWLNSLLYYFDVETLLFSRFDVSLYGENNGENRLKATCYGEKYDPVRHQLKLGVKSATYHMMKIDRDKKQVRVIFDV